MYSYYFVAAMGPQYQKYLWWKRYLTNLQIVQFMSVLVREIGIYSGYSTCNYPWQVSFVSIWITVCFLVLFGNFYRQEYVTKKNRQTKAD
jgi:elongation of very long chain fatty acids protein 7